MSLLREKLENCVITGELVTFYPWEDMDRCLVGRVLKVTSRSAHFELIEPCGHLDREATYLLSSIRAIELGGNYLEGLTFLHKNRERLALEVTRGTKARSPRRVRVLLRNAASTGQPVRLQLAGESYALYAVVLSVHGNWVEVRQVRDGGVLDQEMCFPIARIRTIQVGSTSQLTDAALLDRRKHSGGRT